jgi:hypothetical protein
MIRARASVSGAGTCDRQIHQAFNRLSLQSRSNDFGDGRPVGPIPDLNHELPAHWLVYSSLPVLAPPTDHPFGERQDNAQDFARHRWTLPNPLPIQLPNQGGRQICFSRDNWKCP